LDSLVDSYYSVLEKIGEKLEGLEEDLLNYPEHEMLQEIHNMKRELIFLRRSVWPLREITGRLEKANHTSLMKKQRSFSGISMIIQLRLLIPLKPAGTLFQA
jgi:magnesium transporter